MPKIAETKVTASQVPYTTTPCESQRELNHPMLSRTQQLVSYYQPGRHDNLPGNLANSFHSSAGEKKSCHTGSMQMDLNSEGSSGVDPVEPFARRGHHDGGMVDRPSTKKGGDSRVTNASRHSRKRRLSTSDRDRGKSASTAKRPRTGSLQDPVQTKEGEGRVSATLKPAVRPQVVQPARPRCLADGFSEGRLVIEKRERHRKKEGGFTFQVMRPTQGP
ncbi:hypothetical protein JR316_0013541 [Psilocybe cubensis]|uniref:Uncharacterized protein n=1 Tax=Psilocybe cubensis TaxID=181762 RepID=A0ACB8GEM8_PSICU|nr:uncharacterized protein JR316_0013541 [Psilocybe cubensis]KAH9474160.1 hypothetical protein JR316_0013541 [Psilocybe cubensis]